MIDLSLYILKSDKNTQILLDKIKPYVEKATRKLPAAWTPGISNEEHHAKDMISSSQIKFLMEHDFKTFYDNYITRTITDVPDDAVVEAFSFGTCAHMAVLEPEKFAERVFVCELDKRTKEYKAWCKKNFGVEKLIKNEKSGGYRPFGAAYEVFLISQADYNKCEKYVREIEQHPYLSKCFEIGKRETSGYARCPLTGLDLMIRTDLMGSFKDGTFFIFDPKTSRIKSIADIQNQIGNFSYDLQLAFYLYVANLISTANNEPPFTYFSFIFLKKNEGGGVINVELSEDDINRAFQTLAILLVRIAFCKYTGFFPSYDSGSSITVEMPKWSPSKRWGQIQYLDRSLGMGS